MLKCLKNADWKKTGIFAAGVAFGTAGIKALSSNDAKKFYTNVTAAVLRAKECVMQTVTKVQENAGDIYEEAKQINEERAAKEAVYDDEDLKEVEDEVEAEAEETEAETEETAAEETTEDAIPEDGMSEARQALKERLQKYVDEKEYCQSDVPSGMVIASFGTSKAFFRQYMKSCYGIDFRPWRKELRIREASRFLPNIPNIV